MEQILNKIKRDYPDLIFKPGNAACWAPQDKIIFYGTPFTEKEAWSLCHEIGHAISSHRSFESDIDLLLKEVDAWEKAKELAAAYNIKIKDSHIEKCLDSYRDWLYKRSTCPKCSQKGIHQDIETYTCLNCQTQWKVSSSQINRPYRIKQ